MRKLNSLSFRIMVMLAIIALLAGLGFRYYLNQHQQQQLANSNGVVFPQARVLHPVSLVDGQGKTFTNQNFKGHWNLVFFGFTNCPVICPTTLSILNQAYTKLKNENYQPLPQVIFISVDPERDNPDRASQYAAGFNPLFVGLTGEKAQLDQLTHDMSAVYMKVALKPATAGETPAYTVDHSTAIMLVDPQGNLRAIFSSPENGDKFAQDYQAITQSLGATS